MALAATRVERTSLTDFKLPDDWGRGLGNVYIEEHIYDHPAPQFSIMLKSIKKSTDQYGTLVSEEYDTWDYDEVTRCPRSHRKEIYALIWLPKVTNRQTMVKVEEQRTTYTFGGWLAGGEMEHRTVRAGYVVYNLYPRMVDYTAAEIATLRAKGMAIPGTYTGSQYKEVLNSAKDWKSCIKDSAIVEKPTANQRAKWVDPISEERVWVKEDTQKIVTWTLKNDYLHPGPPDLTKTEKLKDPLSWDIPMNLYPPKIKVQDADGSPTVPLEDAKGVRVEIVGGGAHWIEVDKWREEFVQLYAPDKYMVYRRTVSTSPRTFPSDGYGLHADPGTHGPIGIGRPIEADSVKDYDGTPVSPLPSQATITEPEDPTPPVPEEWTNVGEVANEAKKDGMVITVLDQSHATFFDKSVEHGFTYEYYASAVYGTQESGPSNKETVTYNGPLGLGEGGGDDDYLGPPLPDVPDDYGETKTYDLPTNDDVGADIAKRQFLRNGQNEQVNVVLTAVMLGLERGQLVTLPDVQWRTWTQNLDISSSVVVETFVLEGFGIKAARESSGALLLDAGSLVLEVP